MQRARGTRRSPLRALLVVFTATAIAACTEAGADRSLATVRDSAGITIVENRSPDDSAAIPWLTASGPVLDIGGPDAEGEHALFRVNAATRLTDGSVMVGNSGSFELRRFAADGTVLGSSGRSGDGPGEFRSITSITRGPADTIYVHDNSQRRLSVHTSDGAFVRISRLDAQSGGSILGTLADGTIAATVSAPSVDPSSPATIPDGRLRPDAFVIRYGMDGTVLDTLGRFPTTERAIRTTSRAGTITSIEIMTLPFGHATAFAASTAVVAVGTQDDPEIRMYGTDGTLQRIVRLGRPVQPITEALRAAWIERRMESTPPERQADVRRSYESVPLVETVPTHGRILFDDTGRMWVEDADRPDQPAGRWTVYGVDGRMLARIALPDRFRPLDIAAGEIIGIWRDDLDVEHLQRYTILN